MSQAAYTRIGILSVFLLSAALAGGETQTVPLFAPADDGIQQGFARVVNLSDRSGTVSLHARDDAGVLRWTSFPIGANQVYDFNSDDLEHGNTAKGITGVGDGTGYWYLALNSDLPITVTAYLRADNGSLALAEMYNTVERGLDGVHRVMTFNPGSNRNRESMLRLVNRSGQAITVTVRGIDDQGVSGDRPVLVPLRPRNSTILTARELENMGLGDGSGKWRLLVTAPETIVVMSLMRTATGHLTNLSSAPEGTGVPLFTAASSSRQSFVRIINRSTEAGSATVYATDDSGVVRGYFTIPLGANQVQYFDSNDLENGNAKRGIAGIGNGTGDWRLTVSSDLDIQVLTYMRTADGFLTALHDIVGNTGRRHQVPILNPGSNTRRESVLRIVNTMDAMTSVTVRGYDDTGRTYGQARITLRGNEARMLTAKQLEDMGLGDGSGKWRLSVTATNPVILMSLMRTATGHLTNLSYTPEGLSVIAEPVTASFTYEEEDGIPFGIRFDATASSGDITDYAWNFGESNQFVLNTPGTGMTPRFVYSGRRFFGDTHGGEHGYEGYYPATATYTVTLTVTDRHGAEDTHTEEIDVANTLAFTGARALIDRITDDDEHRGTLVISELGIGEAFEGSHAQRAVYVSMKEEGIPTERIHVEGPGITDPLVLGPFALLTHPDNAALRAETLVVNRSVFPAFGGGYGEDIAANNIVFVGSAGNVSNFLNDCDPLGMPDRDLWHPDHSLWSNACDGGQWRDWYDGMREVIATGKVLYATAAVRKQDGSIEPNLDVIKCGDTMEHCFTVTHAFSTSVATAKLSAAVFHLFQLYDDADDVVHALKSCTEDIGEPGVDREFGQGLVDFRCTEAMLPVVDR